MYSFRNDYSEGAHPAVLRALEETNLAQSCGYGLDPYCAKAAATIRALCGDEEADVHFVVGGTQANLLVIHSFLRSYEAVIAAHTGHVNVHETGAIELTGHKVVAVPCPGDGKLTPERILGAVKSHATEHMVHPRMVYLSNTTEVGTLYTKGELEAIYRCCRENGLFLYLDGARLGSALTAPGSDLTWADIYRCTDAFTIGGTKNGLFFGEAIILRAPELRPHFRSYMKQRGAMLAKGRLLGIQFETILRDGLYLELARQANDRAAYLRRGIEELGYSFAYPSCSNQLFPVFSNDLIAKLEAEYEFETECVVDDTHTCIRLVTSWATPQSAVEGFVRYLAGMTQ